MSVDDHDLFAHGFENSSHPDLATDRIAIGPNVAGKNKALVRTQ
jgi:hypothetical protein